MKRDAIPPPAGTPGDAINPERSGSSQPMSHPMTLEHHYAAAREIWIICEATKRLWLITGDATGTTRPHGYAMRSIRKVKNTLRGRFLVDFPGQHDPYKDIEC